MMPVRSGYRSVGWSALAPAFAVWCAFGCGGAETGKDAVEPASGGAASADGLAVSDAPNADGSEPSGSAADAASAAAVPPCEDAFLGVPCKSGWIAPGTDRLCFGTIESACRCACRESRYVTCKAPAGVEPDSLPDALMPEVVCE